MVSPKRLARSAAAPCTSREPVIRSCSSEADLFGERTVKNRSFFPSLQPSRKGLTASLPIYGEIIRPSQGYGLSGPKKAAAARSASQGVWMAVLSSST